MLLFICQQWFFWNCFRTTPEMKVLHNQRLYSSCTYLCRILHGFVSTRFTATIQAAPYIPVISKLRESKGTSDSGCAVSLIFEHLKTLHHFETLWALNNLCCSDLEMYTSPTWVKSGTADCHLNWWPSQPVLSCSVPLWDRLVDIYPPTLDGSACLETATAKPAISIGTAWHKGRLPVKLLFWQLNGKPLLVWLKDDASLVLGKISFHYKLSIILRKFA